MNVHNNQISLARAKKITTPPKQWSSCMTIMAAEKEFPLHIVNGIKVPEFVSSEDVED